MTQLIFARKCYVKLRSKSVTQGTVIRNASKFTHVVDRLLVLNHKVGAQMSPLSLVDLELTPSLSLV